MRYRGMFDGQFSMPGVRGKGSRPAERPVSPTLLFSASGSERPLVVTQTMGRTEVMETRLDLSVATQEGFQITDVPIGGYTPWIDHSNIRNVSAGPVGRQLSCPVCHQSTYYDGVGFCCSNCSRSFCLVV